MTVLYLLSLLASGLMLVFLIKEYDYKVSSLYSVTYLLVTICDFGYLHLLHAQTLEGALMANALTYIGGSFIPFLVLLSVCRICHVRQKGWMLAVEFVCCICSFLLGATTGVNKLNYTNVWLDTSGTYSILVKEYGPFHIFYIISMVMFVVAAFAVIIWSYRKKREVSYITALGLALICSVDLLIYFVESFIKITCQACTHLLCSYGSRAVMACKQNQEIRYFCRVVRLLQ